MGRRTKRRLLQTAAMWFLLLTPIAACSVNVDLSGTGFRCQLSTECPGEQECIANVCGGTIDASPIDAPVPDAGVPIDAAPVNCPDECNRLDSLNVCLCGTLRTWDDSRGICDSAQLELLRVDNQETSTAIISLVESQGLGSIWLGGSDIAVEGRWVWLDGEVFWDEENPPNAFNDFGPNEPNDAIDGEDCLAANPLEWNDAPCATLLPFLCGQPFVP